MIASKMLIVRLMFLPLIMTSTLIVDSDDQFPQAVAGWERPGCHRIGLTRRYVIPNCVAFQLTTNACHGYCDSWAIPSTWQSLMANPDRRVTVVGQCCNIIDTEDLPVRVMCLDGPRDLLFKSARSCACFYCHK